MKRRPVWRIGLLVLLALVNVVGALLTLSDAPAQYALGLPYSPVFRAATQVVWALVSAWLAWRLFRRSDSIRKFIAPVLTAYSVWGILWLAVFGRSDYDRGRLPFQIVVTIVLLVPFWWAHWRQSE